MGIKSKQCGGCDVILGEDVGWDRSRLAVCFHDALNWVRGERLCLNCLEAVSGN